MSIENCLVDYRAETVLKAIWCVGQNMKKYLTLKKPALAYKKIYKISKWFKLGKWSQVFSQTIGADTSKFPCHERNVFKFFYDREINEIKR